MMTRFLLQQNASRRKKEMRYFDDKYVPRSRTDEINIFLKIFLGTTLLENFIKIPII